MPCILLHPLQDLVQCIYIEGRWTPSQFSIDALHTTTPTARCRPPSQFSTDALHTATPTARSNTMHIYIEGRWTPSKFSIDAFHTTTQNY